jgi:hypothetical protein
MSRSRILKSLAVACVVVATLGATASAQKYGVTVKAEKNFDAAAVKTYTWTKGRPSPDSGIDGQIMAAVDKELARVGVTPAPAGKPDVLITYYSVSRTDVDIKAKPDDKGLRPERTVGSLVVAMLDPASRKPLLQLRIDKPIDRTNVEQSINTLVPELFTKYPGRESK